jgi:hypothetical protein
MVAVADRRDMAWNYYAGAEQKRQRTGHASQIGTCDDCGSPYPIMSDQPDSLPGRCAGCWAARQEEAQEPDAEQPDDTGKPPTT